MQGGSFRQMMEAHTSEEGDMDVDVDVFGDQIIWYLLLFFLRML